jgi:hypothetical protein
MRVLIDLPDEDIQWLDRKAAELEISRAALVREIVAGFRVETGRQGIERYFGAWKDRAEIKDGLQFQRRARDEWDRQ